MKNKLKHYLLPIIVTTLFSFMTIGFALYGNMVSLNGQVTITQPGIIEITSITVVSSTNVTTPVAAPKASGMTIDNINLSCTSATCSVTYLVKIENNSFYEYTFTNFSINAKITTEDGRVPNITATITNNKTGENVDAGTIIGIGDTPEFKVKLDFEIGRAGDISGSGGVSVLEDNSGSIIPISLTPTSGDLQGGKTACFKGVVSNSFKYNRSINFVSSNATILLVDADGNTLGTQEIAANANNSEYDICMKVKEGSSFVLDTTKVVVLIQSNEIEDTILGEVSLSVDIDPYATDDSIPIVGGVTIEISQSYSEVGEALVKWSLIGEQETPVDNYYVRVYNEAGTLIKSTQITNGITNYTFNGLTAGSYYAVVYGEDDKGNVIKDVEAEIAAATTEDGEVSKSEVTALKWTFSIDTTGLTGLASSNTAKEINIYEKYETTLTVTAQDTTGTGLFTPTLPQSLTSVTMGGTTLTQGTDGTEGQYTYDQSTGIITIPKVTGDIVIKANNGTTCLVEGTKIRLANGKYKNIENITYTDLLAVYDHENGGITYEYPIWIEEEKVTNNYQRTTFSDGTILETYKSHAIFSMDTLSYVSVIDKDNFKIGTKVAKVNKDGSIKIVSVTNIETIHEEVKYYQVISTRYHNVISNDFVTSEGTLITTYGLPHNSDLTWSNERKDFLNNNDLFYYEDWTHLFPEHIFKGFRMEEAKYLYNHYQFNIEYFANVLNSLVGSPITNSKGNHLWMVTTSEDSIENNSKYLKEEGSYYTLISPINNNNFIGWYNTADNKMYNIGDKVKVTYGMHFIAKYK